MEPTDSGASLADFEEWKTFDVAVQEGQLLQIPLELPLPPTGPLPLRQTWLVEVSSDDERSRPVGVGCGLELGFHAFDPVTGESKTHYSARIGNRSGDGARRLVEPGRAGYLGSPGLPRGPRAAEDPRMRDERTLRARLPVSPHKGIMVAASGDITLLFEAASNGDAGAFDQVVEKLYHQLESMAGRQMRDRFGRLDGLTLEPAALVNETLCEVLQSPRAFANRRHFFAFAAKVMRHVLLDYQRSRGRQKRGAGLLRVTLSDLGASGATPPETGAAEVAEVLESLERLDSRKSEVAQLRIFWGLEMSEIAELLEVSLATVERDWRFSRSWLATKLELA